MVEPPWLVPLMLTHGVGGHVLLVRPETAFLLTAARRPPSVFSPVVAPLAKGGGIPVNVSRDVLQSGGVREFDIPAAIDLPEEVINLRRCLGVPILISKESLLSSLVLGIGTKIALRFHSHSGIRLLLREIAVGVGYLKLMAGGREPGGPLLLLHIRCISHPIRLADGREPGGPLVLNLHFLDSRIFSVVSSAGGREPGGPLLCRRLFQVLGPLLLSGLISLILCFPSGPLQTGVWLVLLVIARRPFNPLTIFLSSLLGKGGLIVWLAVIWCCLLWDREVVGDFREEVINNIRKILLCNEFGFRVGRRRGSMYPDGWNHPCPELLWQEFMWGGKLPPNVVSIHPAKQVGCRPYLCEACNLFLPAFLIPFVSMQFFECFHRCIDSVPPRVPEDQPQVESLIIEGVGKTLAPNGPQYLSSQYIPGCFHID